MSFKIASAQYPLQQHSSVDSWKEYVESWVQEAAQNQAQLLVFPEYGSMELVSLMSEAIQKNLQQQLEELQKLHHEFVETYKNLAVKYKCSILAPSFATKVSGVFINRAYLFNSDGEFFSQDKKHMTRFEDESWGIKSGDASFELIPNSLGNLGINICYDVEFPQPANHLAKSGVQILMAPSCTENLAGCTRVHVGARARALENQFYVVVSQTVGESPWSEAVDRNTGYAAVYGPPDVGFPDDGIVAQGTLNQVGWVYAEIDLAKIDYVRNNGQVFNFKHS